MYIPLRQSFECFTLLEEEFSAQVHRLVETQTNTLNLVRAKYNTAHLIRKRIVENRFFSTCCQGCYRLAILNYEVGRISERNNVLLVVVWT